MPTIEHSVLPNADLHEPKNINSAASGAVYVADGAGSGVWRGASAYGGWRYSDVSTGTTFTTPTSYTLLNLAGTTTNNKQFSNNGAGRLTYGASSSRIIQGSFSCTFTNSTGSADTFFAIYKNGSILSAESFSMVLASSSSVQDTLFFDDICTNGDYYEIYLKCSSGNVTVKQAYLSVLGVPS